MLTSEAWPRIHKTERQIPHDRPANRTSEEIAVFRREQQRDSGQVHDRR